MKCFAPVFLLLLFFVSSCERDREHKQKVYDNGPTDSLKINEIQIIASHNSYHLKTDPDLFAWLMSLDSLGVLPSAYGPGEIDYEHQPLETQLNDYGVRGFELDINNDPQGGHYYHRQGLSLIAKPTASGIDELNQPGFKIIHIVDFDFNSNHNTFKSALTALHNWSKAHPNHLPLFVNVETKDDVPADQLTMLPNLTKKVAYDADACNKMDEEIKSVFGNELQGVLTPDNLRGTYTTLEEAVLAGNWPQLYKARGKVIFIMQGAAESLYKAGHPSLQDRAMFVFASPGTPEAAFVILNDPVSKYTQIQQRVGQGYIVRTRSDAGTTQARNNDYTDMNAAFSSGAQIISTDYYKPDSRAGTGGWSNYQVKFPNGELARINPVSAATKQDLGVIKE